jgi:ATP-dependent RNA helicase DeaD
MDTPPFSTLGLPAPLLEVVESLGYERPTPIQALTIPVALTGKDVVGLSETGSGKTAAFGLPALATLDTSKHFPQVLILCPTRELAVQVCEEIHRLGANLPGLYVVPVYGGTPYDRQLRALRDGAQVVVGTPGRVLDHLRKGSFKTAGVKMVVLDEADRMLDMGFREEMEELLAMMPTERQTLFFSATMNPAVSRLIQSFGKSPETLRIEKQSRTVATVDQSYFEVRERSKVEVLTRLLDMQLPRLAVIFCNTKRSVDECTEALLARGYAVDRLHGDITQQMRERVLKRFRDSTIELLVATDVAARGLDIEEIDVVFNYDLPQDPEDYVHRIGRTGRAGRSGRAVSFVFGREIHRLESIERYIRHVIRREKIPSQEQVEGRRTDLVFDDLKDRLEAGTFQSHEEYIDRLLEQGHTPTDIASALFTLLRETRSREGEVIAEDREPERPDPRQRGKDRGERPVREKRPFGGNDMPSGEGMAKLFLSLGKAHGVQAGEVAGMLYREAELPNSCLGKIRLFPNHTVVEVPAELAEQVLRIGGRAKLRGRPFRIDYDRGPLG